MKNNCEYWKLMVGLHTLQATGELWKLKRSPNVSILTIEMSFEYLNKESLIKCLFLIFIFSYSVILAFFNLL